MALDNDEAGQKGTERALDLIKRKGLWALVVALPDEYKDTDELIRDKGIEAFKALLAKPEMGVTKESIID